MGGHVANDAAELKESVQIFAQYVETLRTPVRNGMALREQMLADIKAGKIPTGYRYRWILESSKTMLDALAKIVEEFDQAHPDDRASPQDVMDIMAYTAEILKSQI